MRRRDFLPLLVLPLAGCAERVRLPADGSPRHAKEPPVSELTPDLPVTRKTSVAKRGIEDAPEAVSDAAGFREALEARAVAVERLEPGDERLSLDHALDSFDETGLAHALGDVAGVYAAYARTVDDPRPLAAKVLYEGEPAGEYGISAAWAAEYDEGILTAKEYGEKVLGTVKATA